MRAGEGLKLVALRGGRYFFTSFAHDYTLVPVRGHGGAVDPYRVKIDDGERVVLDVEVADVTEAIKRAWRFYTKGK